MMRVCVCNFGFNFGVILAFQKREGFEQELIKLKEETKDFARMKMVRMVVCV